LKSFQIGDLIIPVPFVQGGLGLGISLPGLALAVVSAGGIETIATVGVDMVHGTPEKSFRQNNIDGVLYEIRKARRLTKGVLAVNIMSILINFVELVETAIKEKIDVLFVTKKITTEHKKEVQVIEAGGTTNGKQTCNHKNIGASAMQLDSCFIATKKCNTSTNFNQTFIKSNIKNTRLIESPAGLSGRSIENDFLLAADRGEKRPNNCKYSCIKSCNPKTTN
jgi:NAD(P)H-dependent flavin oxidoreductase YrpB (nitropropane dioxygenase family)